MYLDACYLYGNRWHFEKVSPWGQYGRSTDVDNIMAHSWKLFWSFHRMLWIYAGKP
jgi:hypothetical protein